MAEKDVGLFKIGVETDTSSFENISRTLDKFIKKTAIEKKIRLEVDKSALNDVNKYLRVIENSFTGLDSDVLSDWFGKQMEEISKSDSIDIAVSKYERLIRVLEKFGHINVDIEGFDQVKDLTTFEKYLKSFIGNYESYQKKLDKITKEINKTQSGINIARKMESYWNAGEDGTKKSKTDLNNLIEYISLYESYIKKLNDIEATGGTLTELQNIYKTGLTDNINKLFSESEVIDAFGDLPKILQQSINKTLNNGSIINPFESILDNFKSGIKKSVDSIYGEQLLSVPIDAQFEMKKESYDNIVDRAATAIKQAFKGDSIELEEDVPIQLSLEPKIDEEFQDAIQERIDALKITGEVFVKPKLASTFESDLQNALDARVDGTEAKAKNGEDNEYVNSLNEQLAVFDQKYAKGFKLQTKEEVEEYQKLANTLAEVVTKVCEKRKADQDAVSAEKQAANDLIAEKYKELNAANDALIQSQEELLDRLKNNKGGFAEVAAEIDENRSKVTALNNEIKDLKSTYGVKTSGGISSDATQRVKDLDKEIEAFRNVEKITEELSVDSDEFGNVLRQALNQSTEEADTLLQKLGEIKSVIKTTKTDNITGISPSTYKVTGTTGTATFGSNGITSQTNLLSQETHAESVVAQYKEIQKAVKLVADEEAKAANNRKTFSAAQQAQLMQIKNLEEQIKALDGVNGETFELDTSITSSINQYKKFAEEITNAANAYKKFANGASQTSVNKFLSKMYTWMNQNSKGAKIFKNELTAIIETTKALGPTADLKALEEQFLEIANAIEAAGLQGQSFGDRIKGQVLNSAAGIVTTYLSIQDVIRYVKEAVDTIEDLDYALLDLKKTTDLTDSQLEDFYYTSSDMASQLGITTEEVISLASSWSRLGYGASGVVEDMAKLSAEFAAISPGMTVDEAQEGMVSVMKAYGIEDATEIRREIMDNINALGKVLPKHMVTYGVLKCA